MKIATTTGSNALYCKNDLEALTYKIAKYILESYDLFEE